MQTFDDTCTDKTHPYTHPGMDALRPIMRQPNAPIPSPPAIIQAGSGIPRFPTQWKRLLDNIKLSAPPIDYPRPRVRPSPAARGVVMHQHV